jgi:hypothetical protein
MNRMMRARVPMRHEGQLVEASGVFFATPVDARYLVRNKRAVDITDEQAPLEAKSPNGQGSTGGAATGEGSAIGVSSFTGATTQPEAGAREGATGTTGSQDGTGVDNGSQAAAKPSDGLTVPQLKEELAKRGIEIPAGVTLKADLAALLDGAAQG